MPDQDSFGLDEIISIVSATMNWAQQAKADNQITIVEIAQLGEKIGAIIGVPTSIQLPE